MLDETFIILSLPDLRKLLELCEDGSWSANEVISEFFAELIEADLDVLADAAEK